MMSGDEFEVFKLTARSGNSIMTVTSPSLVNVSELTLWISQIPRQKGFGSSNRVIRQTSLASGDTMFGVNDSRSDQVR
jgi:hypothetical protein